MEKPNVSQDMRDLLEQRHNAIVAIPRPSAGPHLSPVWFLWDGEAFYFRIATNTAKYRNLKRNAAISLMVMDREGYRYLTVSGQAQIMDSNPADVAARIVEKYYAPHLAPQRMPQGPEPDVVTVRLRPEKVVEVHETIAQEAADSWL